MIEKLLKFFNSLPPDKAMHIIVGFVIFAVAHLYSANLAVILVVLAAVGKEAYDYRHKLFHTPDPLDALATIFGGVLGFICTLHL